MITENKLRQDYLDYVNNYLSLDRFAEHRGMTLEQAKIILAMGKQLHEDYCFMLKA